MLHPNQATPSVHFNFDYSNQKTNELQQYIPFEYSFSTNKQPQSKSISKQKGGEGELDCVFATPPPSCVRGDFCKNLLDDGLRTYGREERGRDEGRRGHLCVKLNTEEFFDEFDKNFVVNFGETENKVQQGADFRKTFESCPGVPTIKDSVSSKIESHISEPLARRLSIEPENQQQMAIESPPLTKNQSNEDHPKIDPTLLDKQNKAPNENPKKSKLNCQIRKRVLLKNNEKLSNEVHRRKPRTQNKIINQQNLMIITASNWDNWTDLPIHKKGQTQTHAHTQSQANSQPIKRCEKSLKKAQSNVFTTRFMFKDTLRSTALDSWRKKFTLQKNQHDMKFKNRTQNIFQKPFSLLR